MKKSELAKRLDAVESRLAIGQLPIRYALAIDGRDVDTWVSLFIPNVQIGRDKFGREALRDYITPAIRGFKRSIHQIVGHEIELDPDDPDRAKGKTYCRAEHEVDDRWIVMAICYFDEYQRIGGEWMFSRRIERHWYAVDHLERPQSVNFLSWEGSSTPNLPVAFPTWDSFWKDSFSA